MNEQAALNFYPFDGDMDVYATTLRDKFVTGRKVYECHWCRETIPVGQRHRVLVEVEECEGLGTFRFCAPCCEAMALSWEDNGDAIESRVALGRTSTC